ncbi:MAG: DUF4386 domain-containing protein [Candidatus Eremiobacteraeota bacterium]|nr:DUF4386 domain-containing protein [Candidatus Eremiobacteraeota bacterium]
MNRSYARMAGWLYLSTIVTGLFAEFYVAGKLIDSADPKVTAANILASESLFRAGIVSELLGVAAYVCVSMLLYVILKPAGKNLALFSIFFATVGNALWVVGSLYQFASLRLLHAGSSLTAFNSEQLQALALQSIKDHDAALNVGMVFFGLYCVLIGILLYRSGYFPKALGAVFVAGGVFDFIDELVAFAAPSLAAALPNWVQLPGFIAELSLTLWLIVVGVGTVRMKEQSNQ